MSFARALLLALLAAAPAAAQQTPAPPTPAAPQPPATAPAAQPFVVYLTEEGAPESAAAVPAGKVGDPSPATLAVIAILFLAGAGAWLRLRTPLCPRCRSPVVRLERSAEDTSLLAAGGHSVSGVAPPAHACLACGEVVRPLFLSLMTADRRCPQCKQPTKKTQLQHLERSGYLTWGVVRLDEDCLSCSYRSSEIYPAPPLEAPVAKKGIARV